MWIYAYSDTHFPGYLKIGYTRQSVEKRISQQYPGGVPGEKPYKIEFSQECAFTDKIVHDYLRSIGFENPNGAEWFRCSVEDVSDAVRKITNGWEPKPVERRKQNQDTNQLSFHDPFELITRTDKGDGKYIIRYKLFEDEESARFDMLHELSQKTKISPSDILEFRPMTEAEVKETEIKEKTSYQTQPWKE